MVDTERDSRVTPIFGLTKRQLKPIVESATGEPVAAFEIRVEHVVRGPYGIMGEKVIPTFRYTARPGRREEVVVFAKRQYKHLPDHDEAHHYTYLQQHHAPIPCMYGARTDAEGRESIFLEYLDVVAESEPGTEFLNRGDHFCQFLTAAAHFNAIPISGDYAARLARRPNTPDAGQRALKTASTVARIWDDAAKGQLGDALRQFCTADRLEQLRALAHRLAEPIDRLWSDPGLCTTDLYPHHVGRRRETGELLIFDLEDVKLAPRFSDVAVWLGAPDAVLSRSVPIEQLAQHYLAAYVERGGQPVEVHQLLDEARILWQDKLLNGLGWWRNEALNGPVCPETEDSEGHRRRCSGRLLEELDALLRYGLHLPKRFV